MLVKLFVVGGEHSAMAMVVVGHICTQNIMVVHNKLIHCLRLSVLPWQHVTWLVNFC